MHRFTTIATMTAATTLAQASVTSYTDRLAFDAAVGAQTLEDFESETPGPVAMPNAFDSGLNIDFASGGVSSLIGDSDVPGMGLQNSTVGGQNYLRFGQNLPTGAPEDGSYSIDFTFGGSVQAFGFDISGFQPNQGANGFNMTLFRNGQMVEDFFVPSAAAFNDISFFGFTLDAGFDTARVNIPVIGPIGDSDADYVAFDDVVWSVPSPSALSLLAITGLAATRRRR